MQHSRKVAFRKLHLLLDAALLVAAMGLAYALHASLRDAFPGLKTPPPFHLYAAMAYLTFPLWLTLTALLRLNRTFERPWERTKLFIELVKLHALGLIGLSLAVFLTQTPINRSLVGLFVVSSLLLMFAQRWAISAWVRYRHQSWGQEQLLLLGSPSAQLADFVRATGADSLAPKLIGRLGEDWVEPDDWGVTLPERLGSIDELETVLHERAVDEVVFFEPYSQPESAPEALQACEELGVRANYSIDIARRSQATPHVMHLYDRPFVCFDVSPKGHAALAIKHAFDTVVAVLGIVVLSPLLLVVALAILVTMGRPIFFVQERAGLYGRRFRMVKFRSMVNDAEAKRHDLEATNEMSGPVFKLTKDPRVTRLGSILRKSSTDELPQLFNVLTGTMSIVGPRPLPLGEQQRIRGWQRRRLSMKPGITGLWQVSGRSDIDFEEWMALDLEYIDNWSLAFDLRIVLKTVPVVLIGRGAH